MKKYVIAGAAVAAIAAGVALAQPNDRPAVAADGSISVADLKQREAERFNQLDTNHDGQLSQQELEAGRPFMHGPGGHGRRFGRGPGGPGEGMGKGPGGRFERGGPGGPGGPGRLFQGADANHDGVVTQQELTAEAMRRFQQLDANHDGKVTAEEAQAARARMGEMARKRMGERMFSMLDTDHNGSVSRAEFDRRFAERIERLDANHDGKITPEERRAAHPRPGGPGGPGGPGDL